MSEKDEIGEIKHTGYKMDATKCIAPTYLCNPL